MASKRNHDAGEGSAALESRFLRREARVAGALREVAGALGASLELDELLELVLGKLTELVEAEGSLLFLLDEGRRELVSRVGRADEEPLRIPLGDGWLGQVARTGRGLRVVAEGGGGGEWDEARGLVTRSALLAPLKNNLSRTIGVLLAVNKRTALEFSEDDEEILSVLAKQAAIAIDNSRLLVTLIRKNQQLQQAQFQLTRRVRDLELLFELERSTAHAQSHDELARAVLARLARACDAEGAALVLTQPGAQRAMQYQLSRSFRDAGATREEAGIFRTSAVELRDSALSAVLLGGAPVQVDRVEPDTSLTGVQSVRSLIGEPLDGDEHPIGALGLLDKRGGPFTAEDLGLLRLVSANVSTAVRLFDTNRAREREERLSSIGRLLSQVVHDLKSPLTVISGYVQLMEESDDRATRGQQAGEILKQFQALVAMQREVLAFARGETQVFARRVLLDRFLAELEEQLQRELAGRRVQLIISAERKLVVHFDSERITRALTNLIRNAAEALGDAGGEVRVHAQANDRALILEVSDDGPGVPEEIAPLLFQSFVTSGKRDGTGLGLAIVKRIVEEHGGSVTLAPSSAGARFRIVLPDAVLRPDEITGEFAEITGAAVAASRSTAVRPTATRPTHSKSGTTKSGATKRGTTNGSPVGRQTPPAGKGPSAKGPKPQPGSAGTGGPKPQPGSAGTGGPKPQPGSAGTGKSSGKQPGRGGEAQTSTKPQLSNPQPGSARTTQGSRKQPGRGHAPEKQDRGGSGARAGTGAAKQPGTGTKASRKQPGRGRPGKQPGRGRPRKQPGR
ncbi:MAG TPA: ATP-binding protein, partial [Polyangiaceae bacterium]|nr:ATP-binding protein [Polyangiaceae bacterium]